MGGRTDILASRRQAILLIYFEYYCIPRISRYQRGYRVAEHRRYSESAVCDLNWLGYAVRPNSARDYGELRDFPLPPDGLEVRVDGLHFVDQFESGIMAEIHY
jgi:hypothetical protein